MEHKTCAQCPSDIVNESGQTTTDWKLCNACFTKLYKDYSSERIFTPHGVLLRRNYHYKYIPHKSELIAKLAAASETVYTPNTTEKTK
jgi:hypothetical protein